MQYAGSSNVQGTSMHFGHGEVTNQTQQSATNGPAAASTTSILRNYRKKDNISGEKVQTSEATAAGEAQGPVARVAPHAHYPKPNTDGFRYQHYTDFGMQTPQVVAPPVKYSEIIEPPVPNLDHHLPHMVPKAKDKGYLDMSCGRPTAAKGYDYNFGMRPPVNNMYKQQFPVNPPGAHHPGYFTSNEKPAHPHYPQKDIGISGPNGNVAAPNLGNYAMNYNKMQQQYQGRYAGAPRDCNDFLSSLNKIAPDIAQDIINDQHLREQQFPVYIQDQNRLYRQQHAGMYQQRTSPVHPNVAFNQRNLSYNQYQLNQRNFQENYRFYQNQANLRFQQFEQVQNNVSYPPFQNRMTTGFNHCSQIDYQQHYAPPRNLHFRQEALPPAILPPKNFLESNPEIPEIIPENPLNPTAKSLKSYLENWNEENFQDEDGEVVSKDTIDTLYVLESVSIPTEKVKQYIHLQPIEKLPANVRGFYSENEKTNSACKLLQNIAINSQLKHGQHHHPVLHIPEDAPPPRSLPSLTQDEEENCALNKLAIEAGGSVDESEKSERRSDENSKPHDNKTTPENDENIERSDNETTITKESEIQAKDKNISETHNEVNETEKNTKEEKSSKTHEGNEETEASKQNPDEFKPELKKPYKHFRITDPIRKNQTYPSNVPNGGKEKYVEEPPVDYSPMLCLGDLYERQEETQDPSFENLYHATDPKRERNILNPDPSPLDLSPNCPNATEENLPSSTHKSSVETSNAIVDNNISKVILNLDESAITNRDIEDLKRLASETADENDRSEAPKEWSSESASEREDSDDAGGKVSSDTSSVSSEESCSSAEKESRRNKINDKSSKENDVREDETSSSSSSESCCSLEDSCSGFRKGRGSENKEDGKSKEVKENSSEDDDTSSISSDGSSIKKNRSILRKNNVRDDNREGDVSSTSSEESCDSFEETRSAPRKNDQRIHDKHDDDVDADVSSSSISSEETDKPSTKFIVEKKEESFRSESPSISNEKRCDSSEKLQKEDEEESESNHRETQEYAFESNVVEDLKEISYEGETSSVSKSESVVENENQSKPEDTNVIGEERFDNNLEENCKETNREGVPSILPESPVRTSSVIQKNITIETEENLENKSETKTSPSFFDIQKNCVTKNGEDETSELQQDQPGEIQFNNNSLEDDIEKMYNEENEGEKCIRLKDARKPDEREEFHKETYPEDFPEPLDKSKKIREETDESDDDDEANVPSRNNFPATFEEAEEGTASREAEGADEKILKVVLKRTKEETRANAAKKRKKCARNFFDTSHEVYESCLLSTENKILIRKTGNVSRRREEEAEVKEREIKNTAALDELLIGKPSESVETENPFGNNSENGVDDTKRDVQTEMRIEETASDEEKRAVEENSIENKEELSSSYPTNKVDSDNTREEDENKLITNTAQDGEKINEDDLPSISGNETRFRTESIEPTGNLTKDDDINSSSSISPQKENIELVQTKTCSIENESFLRKENTVNIEVEANTCSSSKDESLSSPFETSSIPIVNTNEVENVYVNNNYETEKENVSGQNPNEDVDLNKDEQSYSDNSPESPRQSETEHRLATEKNPAHIGDEEDRLTPTRNILEITDEIVEEQIDKNRSPKQGDRQSIRDKEFFSNSFDQSIEEEEENELSSNNSIDNDNLKEEDRNVNGNKVENVEENNNYKTKLDVSIYEERTQAEITPRNVSDPQEVCSLSSNDEDETMDTVNIEKDFPSEPLEDNSKDVPVENETTGTTEPREATTTEPDNLSKVSEEESSEETRKNDTVPEEETTAGEKVDSSEPVVEDPTGIEEGAEESSDESVILQISTELIQIHVTKNDKGEKVISITPLTNVKIVANDETYVERENAPESAAEDNPSADKTSEEIDTNKVDEENIEPPILINKDGEKNIGEDDKEIVDNSLPKPSCEIKETTPEDKEIVGEKNAKIEEENQQVENDSKSPRPASTEELPTKEYDNPPKLVPEDREATRAGEIDTSLDRSRKENAAPERDETMPVLEPMVVKTDRAEQPSPASVTKTKVTARSIGKVIRKLKKKHAVNKSIETVSKSHVVKHPVASKSNSEEVRPRKMKKCRGKSDDGNLAIERDAAPKQQTVTKTTTKKDSDKPPTTAEGGPSTKRKISNYKIPKKEKSVKAEDRARKLKKFRRIKMINEEGDDSRKRAKNLVGEERSVASKVPKSTEERVAKKEGKKEVKIESKEEVIGDKKEERIEKGVANKEKIENKEDDVKVCLKKRVQFKLEVASSKGGIEEEEESLKQPDVQGDTKQMIKSCLKPTVPFQTHYLDLSKRSFSHTPVSKEIVIEDKKRRLSLEEYNIRKRRNVRSTSEEKQSFDNFNGDPVDGMDFESAKLQEEIEEEVLRNLSSPGRDEVEIEAKPNVPSRTVPTQHLNLGNFESDFEEPGDEEPDRGTREVQQNMTFVEKSVVEEKINSLEEFLPRIFKVSARRNTTEEISQKIDDLFTEKPIYEQRNYDDFLISRFLKNLSSTSFTSDELTKLHEIVLKRGESRRNETKTVNIDFNDFDLRPSEGSRLTGRYYEEETKGEMKLFEDGRNDELRFNDTEYGILNEDIETDIFRNPKKDSGSRTKDIDDEQKQVDPNKTELRNGLISFCAKEMVEEKNIPSEIVVDTNENWENNYGILGYRSATRQSSIFAKRTRPTEKSKASARNYRTRRISDDDQNETGENPDDRNKNCNSEKFEVDMFSDFDENQPALDKEIESSSRKFDVPDRENPGEKKDEEKNDESLTKEDRSGSNEDRKVINETIKSEEIDEGKESSISDENPRLDGIPDKRENDENVSSSDGNQKSIDESENRETLNVSKEADVPVRDREISSKEENQNNESDDRSKKSDLDDVRVDTSTENNKPEECVASNKNIEENNDGEEELDITKPEKLEAVDKVSEPESTPIPKTQPAKSQSETLAKINTIIQIYRRALQNPNGGEKVKQIEAIIDKVTQGNLDQIRRAIEPSLRLRSEWPGFAGGTPKPDNVYEVSTDRDEMKLHLKKVPGQRKRKRKRFRNLYAEDSEDDDADEPDAGGAVDDDDDADQGRKLQKFDDYSIVRENRYEGPPTKLVIKLKKNECRENAGPYVRLTRAPLLEEMVKKRKRTVLLT